MSETKSEQPMTFETWEDDHVDMKLDLLRGIISIGFENPSSIQKRSILPMFSGRDVIAQAQSGTGKTGAFTIGSLQHVDEDIQETQCLVLSPTHELAIQNYNVFKDMSSFMGIQIELLIGGSSIDEDHKKLEKKPHVVVGCPGRVFDMLRRDWLSPKHIRVFILDEADEMLSSGFKDQIYNIFQYLREDVQVGLFSATMPEEVKQLTKSFMRDPVTILVNADMLTLEGIQQYYINLGNDNDKYETLKDLFQTISLTQTIIYCNSIERVQDLTNAMIQDNFPVVCIHSGMKKEERREVFQDFKTGKYRVLISSDVTARGIDIQQVSVVINFDLCKNKHTYLHRIGRSGRWGRKGIAINMITKRDIPHMKEIQSYYNTQIEELPEDFKERIRY